MSLTGMFDHTVRVHRLTETVDNYRSAVNRYVQQSGTLRGTFVPPKFRASQTEAGTQLTGVTEFYSDADADVQLNDVLEAIAGPEAPNKYRVISTAKPRGHHLEAICEPFTRSLTAAVAP